MKLYAISDLHLGSGLNLEALDQLAADPEDWLILAGDVGETIDHLRYALDVLAPRFARLLWVPGNHDLWAIDPHDSPLRGEDKYRRLVEICRSFDVLTPEDPYAIWPGSGDRPDASAQIVLAPLFLLYDYSFRPDGVAEQDAVDWARASGVFCTDEELLDPAPHRSRQEWCRERVLMAERRLTEAAADGQRLILINHFPLRHDLVILQPIPCFSIWCGTRATENWHLRFNAEAVIYGHLHLPATHIRDGVRFEEVSFGYPSDRDQHYNARAHMRQILPNPREGQ